MTATAAGSTELAAGGDTQRSGGTVAIATMASQVLSSASNALVVFVLAQASSAELFGVVALMVTTVAVCTGFSRGALGTPLLLTSALPHRQIAAEAGYATSWSLGMGGIAGVVLVVGGLIVGEPAIGLAFAVSIPFVLGQDVLRMTAIALRKPGRALVADTLWTAVMFGFFVANLTGARVSPVLTIYVWGAAGLVSGVLLAVWCGVVPRTLRIWDWWCTYRSARLRFGSLPASSQVAVLVVVALAAYLVSDPAAAGLRGAMTLFGPITVLVAALPMVVIPHIARTRDTGDVRTQWRQLAATSLLTALATLAAAFGLGRLPDDWGTALLGQTWSHTLPLIPAIGVQWAAMAWLVSVYTFFQAVGASRIVLWLNVVHIVLQVGAVVVAGLYWASAGAIGVAIAVAGWSTVAIGLVAVQVWQRRTARSAPTRATADAALTPKAVAA